MPVIVLASALARWLPPGSGEPRLRVSGASLREALEAAFAEQPGLRGYVLDEHGALRHHVAVFVDGQVVRDKRDLAATAVAADAEIYLMQALSEG